MLLAGSLAAQTPQTSSGVPDESFLAEQFCFETQFSNSGAVGYGPYLRIELADGLTLDSVEIFGTGGTLIDAGEFPPAPDNQLDDPVIGEAVTGEPITGSSSWLSGAGGNSPASISENGRAHV